MAKKSAASMKGASHHGVKRTPVASVRAGTTLTDLDINRVSRARLGQATGYTYDGKRNVFEALGYAPTLRVSDYRARFYRNAVAARIVECFPRAAWRGGAELVEDEDPSVETAFEVAWGAFALKFNVWQELLRADILAGLGTYAGLVLGAKGKSETELRRGTGLEDMLYFAAYAEDELKVESYVESTQDPRFGLPEYYQLSRSATSRATNQPRHTSVTGGQRWHWTRVLHIADGLLDDRCFGTPRLERVWNLCDDLEKVTGGGSEAFWQRAQQGLQLDVDPTVVLDDEDKRELQQQADEFLHGQRRMFRTRGVSVKSLGSDTANFESNVKAIMMQIAAGSNLPMRILTGSESGELASSQDRTNWAERVSDRRKEVCEPHVRVLVNRLIEYGYLPKPKAKTGYYVDWPREKDLNEEERTTIAARMAVANQAQATGTGYVLMTSDEIRDRYLSLPPLDEVMDPEELADGGRLILEAELPDTPGVDSVEETTSRTEVENKKTKAVAATVEALRRRREMSLVPPAGRVRVKRALRNRTLRRYARAS